MTSLRDGYYQVALDGKSKQVFSWTGPYLDKATAQATLQQRYSTYHNRTLVLYSRDLERRIENERQDDIIAAMKNETAAK